MTDSADVPVVGTVGAGLLARMTVQAAIGLGVGYPRWGKEDGP